MEVTKVEIAKIAEESEVRQLNFPLRWKIGVRHGESLVIFGPLAKINTDLSASDEEYSDEEEDNDSEVTEDSHEPLQRGLAQYPLQIPNDGIPNYCTCCNTL